MVFALYLHEENGAYEPTFDTLLGLYSTEAAANKAKKRWKSEMVHDDGSIGHCYDWELQVKVINLDIDLWPLEVE